jgi:hypothetical protein
MLRTRTRGSVHRGHRSGAADRSSARSLLRHPPTAPASRGPSSGAGAAGCNARQPPRHRLIARAGQQVAGLLGNPPPSRVSGDADQVHPSAAELDDEQDKYAPQEDRVDGEEVAGQDPGGLLAQERPPTRRARRGAGSRPWARSTRLIELADTRQPRRSNSPWIVGSPTADSREQAARPAAAPRRISQAVHGWWWGRSSAGRSCAGASAAASRVAPGTPTSAPVGAAGSAPRAAPGRWAAGGAVDAGDPAPRARGVTPGSRSPWRAPTGSRT